VDVVYRRAGNERWREVFVFAEQRLGRNDWTVERYSIADIHLFRLFWRFVDALHPDRGTYPNLYAHYDRVMAWRGRRCRRRCRRKPRSATIFRGDELCLDVAEGAARHHPVALDQLGDAVIDRKARPEPGALDLLV
jgi:hypothetical protein